MTKTIYFEQPTNEHIRVCLRLEHLFEKTQHYSQGETPWHSREMLETLLEILNILDRPDLKSTFIKELNRHHANLLRLNNIPNVDNEKLESILHESHELIETLGGLSHKLVVALRENEFLNSIRHHLINPGGANDFDCPALHSWLEQPYSIRKRYLNYWLTEIEIINRTVGLILRLIRDSGVPEYKTAMSGFYQEALDAKIPCQLVRVGVAIESSVYPEISVGSHRICVRFLKTNFQSRAQQSPDEVIFKLTCCVF